MPVRYPLPPPEESSSDEPPSGTLQGRHSGALDRTLTAGLIGGIAVVALIVAVFAYAGGKSSPALSPDTLASYYPSTHIVEVELTTGEVFFGKISSQAGLLQLSYVYYYSQPSGQLVQRGSEPFAPNGPMVINPAQVVKIEPVGPNSTVARQISSIESGHGQGSPMTTTTTAGEGFQ